MAKITAVNALAQQVTYQYTASIYGCSTAFMAAIPLFKAAKPPYGAPPFLLRRCAGLGGANRRSTTARPPREGAQRSPIYSSFRGTKPDPATGLRACYEKPAHGATWCGLSGTDLAYGATRKQAGHQVGSAICLRAHYAKTGTDLAYAAMLCPVWASRNVWC
eukprot:2067812-Rhodomonas_salina.1